MIRTLFILFAVLLFSCAPRIEEKEILPEKTSTTSEPVTTSNDKSLQEDTVQNIFDSTVVCKDYGGNMEEGYTKVCDFNSKTLQETYSYYITTKSDDAKYLEKNLPLLDTSVKQTDVSVDYKWESKSKLITNLRFAGGETTITFEEKKGKTQVIFYSSPD